MGQFLSTPCYYRDDIDSHIKIQQGILRTLYLTRAFECATCTGHVERLRACHIMEAKIMKHHVLPRELAKFWLKTFAVFKMKLNFLTDIVLRAQLRTVQTVSS